MSAYKKIHALLLVGTTFFTGHATIHVFGDSHAFFCFSNRMTRGDFDENSIFCSAEYDRLLCTELSIRATPSITMHRIGRDGLAILNIQGAVREGDTVVFVYGEIDVRCHIGKQRDQKNRSLHEVIDTLIANYVKTINENVQPYKQVKVVILSTVPPCDPAPQYISLPMHGTLEDRVQINNALCDKLKHTCQELGYYFLDIRPHFSELDGSLKFDLSDGIVHVGLPYNRIIKEELLKLIA
jgi:hypothetical protein